MEMSFKLLVILMQQNILLKLEIILFIFYILMGYFQLLVQYVFQILKKAIGL